MTLRPDPDSLIAEIRELRASRDAAQERAFRAEQDNATLRLIVTERLAEHGFTVKAEDAADVARWAQRPDAVRELLKHEPTYADFNDRTCPCCGVGDGEAHRRGELPHDEHCPIAAAWRALGDPRGAADIERAHEEALRQHTTWAGIADRERAREALRRIDEGAGDEFGLTGVDREELRVRAELPRTVTHGEWGPALLAATESLGVLGPGVLPVFRLASERPLQGIHGAIPVPRSWRLDRATIAAIDSRIASDARGMGAVEAEARFIDWGFDDATRQADRLLALRSVGREPFEP